MREIQALVAPQKSQGVVVRDQASLAIDKLLLKAEFLVEEWGNEFGAGNGASARVKSSKRAFRRWVARLTLAIWRATAMRATGHVVSVVIDIGGPGCPQTPQGVLARGQAGLVISELSRVPQELKGFNAGMELPFSRTQGCSSLRIPSSTTWSM